MRQGLFVSLDRGVDEPLAARLRPQSLAEVSGQIHLLGHGRPLWQLIEQQKLHSLILWGPPGYWQNNLGEIDRSPL